MIDHAESKVATGFVIDRSAEASVVFGSLAAAQVVPAATFGALCRQAVLTSVAVRKHAVEVRRRVIAIDRNSNAIWFTGERMNLSCFGGQRSLVQ